MCSSMKVESFFCRYLTFSENSKFIRDLHFPGVCSPAFRRKRSGYETLPPEGGATNLTKSLQSIAALLQPKRVQVHESNLRLFRLARRARPFLSPGSPNRSRAESIP